MLYRGDAETQRETQLTEKIIGCAIEVHKVLGTVSWNRLMKNAFVTNSRRMVFRSDARFHCPSYIKA
jgi:hypothetical protein